MNEKFLKEIEKFKTDIASTIEKEYTEKLKKVEKEFEEQIEKYRMMIEAGEKEKLIEKFQICDDDIKKSLYSMKLEDLKTVEKIINLVSKKSKTEKYTAEILPFVSEEMSSDYEKRKNELIAQGFLKREVNDGTTRR